MAETSTLKYSALRDAKKVKAAILECIAEGEIAEAKAILRSHMELTNKVALAKRAGMSRKTLYNVIDPESDPRLSSVSQILNAL